MLLPSSALPGLLALSLQLPLSALQRGLQGSSSMLGQSMRKDCGSDAKVQTDEHRVLWDGPLCALQHGLHRNCLMCALLAWDPSR